MKSSRFPPLLYDSYKHALLTLTCTNNITYKPGKSHNPTTLPFHFSALFGSKNAQELCTLATSLSSLQIHSSSHSTPATVCIPLNLLIKLPNDPLMPNSVLTYLVPIILDFSAAFSIVDDSFLLGILGFCDFSPTSLFIHLVGYLSVFC